MPHFIWYIIGSIILLSILVYFLQERFIFKPEKLKADFQFKYDAELAKSYLAKSGHGPDKPVKIGFAATSGHFPSDYDIARAIVQMWN